MELMSSYLCQSQPSSPDNLQFYSAPTSPMGRIDIGLAPYGYESDNNHPYKTDDDVDDDGFEFETSQRVGDGWRSQSSPTFDYCPLDDANSFSTMAFADELFSDGHVLPLKLPPRLLQQQNCSNSIPTSPNKSPLRIPFGRRSAWNDNFDPFMVALDKVSDESRGRKSVHRRTRSLSPYRTVPINDSNQQQAGPPNSKKETVQEAKGLSYARWVRSQTMGHKRSSSSVIGASSKSLTKAKTSLFGSKRTGEVGFSAESKMQKVKSILFKYTSFRKENSPSIAATPTRKPGNFFNKLSFKFKGGNDKKKVLSASSTTTAGESKIMALVKYNPKLPLCLGYVPASPTHL